MGKHSSHARGFSPRAATVLAAVLSLVVIVAVAVAVQRRHGSARPVASTPIGGSTRSTSVSAPSTSSGGAASNGACTPLRVVAASSIAGAVRQVAATLTTGPGCIAVTVTTADGEDASSVVVRDHADVWIPDDSAWLNLPVAAALASGDAPVIASSPLYFVTKKGTALPDSARTWLGLGDTLATRGRLKLVLSDPAASGAALVGAGALVDVGIEAHGPLVSALNVMRAWQAGRTVDGTAPAFPK